MNEPLRKAQAFGEEYIEQIPLRLTAAEMQTLKFHLQVAYSTGYRDASRDCSDIVTRARAALSPVSTSVDDST